MFQARHTVCQLYEVIYERLLESIQEHGIISHRFPSSIV